MKHLSGPDWRQHGASLDADAARRAFAPSLALAGPTPYVAWAETAGAVFSVHVKALE